MASGDNAIIDSEKAGVVDFAARMVRLKEFCGTKSLNSSGHRRSRT
jgi:hypothetical protein